MLSRERKAELVEELSGWERAYPLSAFPEPDLAKAAELLKAGGMTLDAVSASNMRHVVSRLAPMIRELIEAIPEEGCGEAEGWRDIESAPKDGTRVLLAPHMMTGWWEFGDDEWMVTTIPLEEDRTIANDWTVLPKLFFCLYAKQFGVEPTHWRPLAAPPVAASPTGVGEESTAS
jgi:hypothetical protein